MRDARRPFLDAILDRPDDDLPRLIYADWLDEHGDGERAEFIRVQCELARRLAAGLRGTEDSRLAQVCPCETCVLRRRERELHWRCGPDWLLPLRTILGVERDSLFGGHADDGFFVQGCCKFDWWFRRGFVEEIACTAYDFLRHVWDLVNATPLRVVNLTTEMYWRPTPPGFELRSANDGRWTQAIAVVDDLKFGTDPDGTRTIRTTTWPWLTVRQRQFLIRAVT